MSLTQPLQDKITDFKQTVKQNPGLVEVSLLTILISIILRLYWFYNPFLLPISLITTLLVLPIAAYRISTAPINILMFVPLYTRALANFSSILTFQLIKYIQISL